MGDTIKRNNGEMYRQMRDFLDLYNNNPAKWESQVPTALVITSSESASSIDTQFTSLCEELKLNLHTHNVILDDKKCGTLK